MSPICQGAPAIRHELLGVPIDALTLQEVLDRVEGAISSRVSLHISVVNAAKLANMRRDALLRDDVLSGDLILADGISLVWASRLLGQPLPERVAGIDLMHAMLERASRYGWSVYCLGASQDVLAQAMARIAADYPGVRLAGCRNGYFSSTEEAEVGQAIAEAAPDILLVAMSSPKKEQFLARWQPDLQVPVCHGVGGSFDVLAGKVQRAPLWWQRLGLEWLYRLKQEPRRLWKRYLVTNSLFCALLVRAMILRAVRIPR
jgi:N-acetylglucosaminyldiphosphoundecaprenol N-acetyl-beta-D-mannosaminyltransferase